MKTERKEFRYKGYQVEIDYHTDSEHDGFVWTFYDAEKRSTDSLDTCSCFRTKEEAAKAAMKAIDADIIEQEVASGDYKF
jgi:hypothetical protein